MTEAGRNQAERRTQAQRREKSIGALIDATIAILGGSGYGNLTFASVASRAGLSQGGLTRHFKNRYSLIAAATEEICHRHLTLIAEGLATIRASPGPGSIAALVHSLRAAARTQEHAAWHEVMVAARTDPALHELVAPTLMRFEQGLLAAVAPLGSDRERGKRLGTIFISLMHLLDSEAVTVAVYDNPPLIEDRTRWLIDLLGRELAEVSA